MLVRRFSFAIRSWTFSNSGAKIQEKLIIFAIFQSEILSIFIYDKGEMNGMQIHQLLIFGF